MVNIRQISPELAEKARTELNEVEQRIPEDIAALREWIEKQPHLCAKTTDQFLVTFLRGCKYSLEKAKQKIDFFYTMRSMSPDYFLHKQINEKSIKLDKIGVCVPLPKPLKPDGPRIVFTRHHGLDINEFSFFELFQNQLRMSEILMFEDDNCAIGGVINVADMSEFSMGLMLKFDPILMKKMGVFTEKAMPLRLRGAHMVNMPKEAATLLNLIQRLMPDKIKKRMMIHTSMESLYEHIPQEYLPEEYGGSNGRLSEVIEDWSKVMLKHKEYFEEDEKYKTNEKLRLGTPVSFESVFGLDGSFRKLDID